MKVMKHSQKSRGSHTSGEGLSCGILSELLRDVMRRPVKLMTENDNLKETDKRQHNKAGKMSQRVTAVTTSLPI